VYRWLSDEGNGQWLIVLDNADDDGIFFHQDVISGETPLIACIPQTKNGSVIVTSRSLSAAMSLIGTYENLIHVGPMDETDALDLLKTKVPLNTYFAYDAEMLINALECIPLAIAHAGSYIQMRSPRITLSTYLKLLQESEMNLAALLNNKDVRDLRRDYGLQHTVIATWQISFEQIQKSRPEACDLLAVMSIFDKQGIPQYLLQRNMSKLQFEDAVTTLVGFSHIKEEEGCQSFEMHRLVQISMRKWLESNNQLEKWIKRSAEILATTFLGGDYKTWPESQALLPHVKEIMRHSSQVEQGFLSWATLADKVGWYLFLKGWYEEAEVMHGRALRSREQVLGPEHPDTLSSISQLGSVIERQGKYKEAETVHRQALRSREKILGPEHPDTLISTSHLGLVLQRQGEHEEAEAIYRRALKAKGKILGPEHPSTLISVSQLGSVLERQGKYREAEAMHRQVLKDREKVLGPEHPRTLTSISKLGSILQRQEKYKEAEAMHRQALKGREKMLGPDHPGTLISVIFLGSVLKSQAKYEEVDALRR
jgi:tetratricopeptide (TPR) repeat protein